MIYHNEAYSRSNSSVESSPVSSKHSLKECTPSPKSGSFVSAVIGAIRNAATHPFATKNTDKKSSLESAKQIYKGTHYIITIYRRIEKNRSINLSVIDHSELSMESSSDLLDFETEPCLMMESVLEDVPLPDTYSHNMVSSSDSLRRALSFPETVDEGNLKKTRTNEECSSLTNLTQAILHRRKVTRYKNIGNIFIKRKNNHRKPEPLYICIIFYRLKMRKMMIAIPSANLIPVRMMVR